MDFSPPGSFIHVDSLDKNTGVDCHALIQGIFPTQGSNLCLVCRLHLQVDYLPLAPSGKTVGNIVGCNSLGTLKKSKELCYLEEFTAPAAVGHLREYRTHEKR